MGSMKRWRWLLLLLVALLPLRGWVGDAMAGEMLRQQVAAVSEAVDIQAVAHHDCMGQEQAPADAPQTMGADCPTCAACQVCSSAAVILSTATPAAIAYSAPCPACAITHYDSAERSLALKPPIS